MTRLPFTDCLKLLPQARHLCHTTGEMCLITLALCLNPTGSPKCVPLRCSVWNTQYSKFNLVGSILNVQISHEMTDLAMLSPCALKSAMAEAWCLLST